MVVAALVAWCLATPGCEAPLPFRDLAQAWPRIRALAHLESYLPVPARDPFLPALLRWVPGKAGTVYDRSCQPVPVTRSAGSLQGSYDLHTSGGPSDDERTTTGSSLSLSSDIEAGDGFTRLYRRNRRGEWELRSVAATSGASVVGGLLSRVTDEAAWYDGHNTTLTLRCTALVHETTSCAAGGERTCDVCRDWGLAETDAFPSNGVPNGVPNGVGVLRPSWDPPVDCSLACAPVAPPPAWKDAAHLVAGHTFLLRDGDPPAIFRSRAACERYWKTHPSNPAGRAPLW